MTALYTKTFIEILRRGAESIVGAWGLSPRTDVSLLTISENATFQAKDPERDETVILRVYRPGYHTRQEIESELAWINDLRRHAVVDTPEPLTARDGGHIATFDQEGMRREVVAFRFMSGVEPSASEHLADGFHKLGGISARLHDHARRWARPDGFVRKTWTWETTLGPSPHWGDWRDAFGLEAEGQALLERTSGVLKDRLAAYGTDASRFGLIHADLRLANLLVEGDRLGVIDFDDCGFGWFGYDFAAAVSFLEHEPYIPTLQEAWVEGYRAIAPLPKTDEVLLPTFVMVRRLLLTAWIASHAETPTAQDLGAGYTQGTLMLADRFLGDLA